LTRTDRQVRVTFGREDVRTPRAHLYLLGALRARVVPARSAQRGGGKKPWKMQENIFLFWDFVFWRTARQGCAGAQRASYGTGGVGV